MFLFKALVLLIQYGTLVEVICQGMPDFDRGPIETGQLSATDEPSKKKEVLKSRKKVNSPQHDGFTVVVGIVILILINWCYFDQLCLNSWYIYFWL